MSTEDFLQKLDQNPDDVTFDQTMQLIDENYAFVPTAFINGMIKNEVGENNGSCKLFAFAKLNKLSAEKTERSARERRFKRSHSKWAVKWPLRIMRALVMANTRSWSLSRLSCKNGQLQESVIANSLLSFLQSQRRSIGFSEPGIYWR